MQQICVEHQVTTMGSQFYSIMAKGTAKPKVKRVFYCFDIKCECALKKRKVNAMVCHALENKEGFVSIWLYNNSVPTSQSVPQEWETILQEPC